MASAERESTVEEAFKEACASVWEHRMSNEYDAVRMQLYGLYKVAKEGKCQEPRPKPDTVLGGEKNMTKWEAWMKASTFSKEEAVARYVSAALSVVRSRGDAAAEVATGSSGHTLGVSGGGDAGTSVGEAGGVGDGGDAGGSATGAGSGSAGGDAKPAAAKAKAKAGGPAGGAEDAQMQEIERLRKHTESLERYVAMIRDELSLATDHLEDVEVGMSGWLSKWRDRDVYLWGSVKWERRFFTLADDTLTTYKSDRTSEVESVMSLKRCVLRDEGTRVGKSPGRGKPCPQYHVFGLYLEGALQRGPDAGVLLRLSTDNEEEAERWISALGEVCAQEEDRSSTGSPTHTPTHTTPTTIRDGEAPFAPNSSPGIAPPAAAAAAAAAAAPLVDGEEALGTPRMGRVPSVGMSRKGSWDVAGGLNNLQHLKRLTKQLSMNRLVPEQGTGTGGHGTGEEDRAPEPKKPNRKNKKKKFKPTGYPASRPMHKESKVSILSGNASTTQNYRGLLNLMAILLLVTNSRLIAANLRRYGVLASVPKLSEPSDLLEVPRIAGTMLLSGHAAFALLVEKLAMPRPGNTKGILGGTEGPVLLLHGANVFLCLAIAVATVWVTEGSPVFGFAYLFTAVILWLKLISYAHCNRDLRLAWRERALAAKEREEGPSGGGGGGGEGEEGAWRGGGGTTGGWSVEGFSDAEGNSGEQQSYREKATSSSVAGGVVGGGDESTNRTRYPGNIGVLDLLYFWFAPTLCYQPDYPRSKERRYRYIVSLVVRLVIVGGAMSLIADQYMLPTVHEVYRSDPAANMLVSFERLLTLAVPNTYFWLLGFYAFFHLTLNLLAEVLMFGDRLFYRDWWNANTIDAYWRLWNLPVHYWMVRHVYFPCLRAGVSKNVASGLCFLLSAVLHELLVSVPFHMVKFYAFFGMIGNVPLVPLTKMLNAKLGDDQQAGNWIFWVLFCVVGQPMSLLCYYRDYCSEHECSNPLMN